jgi:hypothetical protein
VTVVTNIPSLSEAQGIISDWEERWQLCFSLGLLPKDGVFQLPAGGLASCPGKLLAVLLLLTATAEDCAAVAAVAAAANDAAAAAVASAAGGGGGSKEKKQQKGRGKGKGGGSKQAAAAAAAEDPAAVVERGLSAIQVGGACWAVLSLQPSLWPPPSPPVYHAVYCSPACPLPRHVRFGVRYHPAACLCRGVLRRV